MVNGIVSLISLSVFSFENILSHILPHKTYPQRIAVIFVSSIVLILHQINSSRFCFYLYYLLLQIVGLPRCNKAGQTGWLKQQQFFLSQFWRLEVWEQGVKRVGSFQGLWEKICSMCLSYFLVVCWDIFDISWPVCASAVSLSSIFTWCSPYTHLSLCLNLPVLQGHQLYWIRTHSNYLILTWLSL